MADTDKVAEKATDKLTDTLLHRAQQVGAVLLALGIAGTWLWNYAGQAASVANLSVRIERLETHDDATSKLLNDMNARMVRIETMVTVLVDKKVDRDQK